MLAQDTSSAERALAALYERRKGDGASALRENAWASFARSGLPNRRVENWRYTDLRAALRDIAPEPQASGAVRLTQDDCLRIGIVAGEFISARAELAAAPAGVTITSLREELARGDPEVISALAPQTGDAAVDLNAALMQDGAVIRIAPGAQIERPLSICTALAGEASAFTRSLILVGAGAKVTIIEEAAPLHAGGQENNALILRLGADAEVELVDDIGSGQPDAVRVYTLIASLARGAALNATALICGGGLLRRQIFATLNGEGASVAFNGAALLNKRAHADVTLSVRHEAPQGKSRERFRFVVDDEATGVFQGKTSVAQLAQKTDGAMQSKALLLSAGATMNNKPELEIFADDVICGHGATSGRLDAEQTFYLTARGLPRAEAEALLIEGFANEALQDIGDERLRDRFAEKVADWLAMRKQATKGQVP